jgi:very-short-patch-repair endonuclease
VVEVDGFGAHGTRYAFEADRARDIQLKLIGHDVVRFTWRQIVGDASAVAATLRALLG